MKKELSTLIHSIIIPSRPGYGKTSRALGRYPAETSEHYTELFNHLGIDKTHIIAVSAGGPSGINLARQECRRDE